MIGSRAFVFRRFLSSSVSRNPIFGKLEDKDVSVFQSILGASNVKTTDIDGFNEDWMKWYKGLFYRYFNI